MKTVEMSEIKLTKGMENFLYNDVLPTYILYSRKDNYAFCTSCQNEVPLPDTTRPKMEVTCPVCKRKALLKAKGQTKNKFYDSGVGIIIAKDGKDLCVRYIEVSKYYNPDGTVNHFHTKESLREYIYPDGKLVAYDNAWDYGWRRCNTRAYSNYRGAAGEPCYHINLNWKIKANYKKNLKNVVKGTAWEHSCINEIMKMHDSHHYWDVYRAFLKDYAKCPYAEYLYKIGFKELLQRGTFIQNLPFDLSKKTLPDIMMVRKELYRKMLANGNPTYDDLIKYQDMTKFNLATEDDYKFWHKYFNNNSYHYRYQTDPAQRFREHFKKSWYQLDKYATETKDFSISLYEDYLKMCDDLNYDMNNTFVVFPKDLKQAHDNLVGLWNKHKNEEAVKKAKARNNEYNVLRDKYTEQFAFAEDNLQIVVPNGCEDICLEGQKLHHCVGTYIDKVCKGMSIILFVRNIAKITKPFYTMEVKENRIVQCRGFGNKEVTDEVRKFISDFASMKQLTMNYIA